MKNGVAENILIILLIPNKRLLNKNEIFQSDLQIFG